VKNKKPMPITLILAPSGGEFALKPLPKVALMASVSAAWLPAIEVCPRHCHVLFTFL